MEKKSSKTAINPILGMERNRIKILFVCHGNICRSPMAQYVFEDMVAKEGKAEAFYIDSAATSTEEIGNPIHRGTRSKLIEKGIPFGDHRAVQLRKADYKNYDYLIGMDRYNIKNITRMVGGDKENKVYKLLDFTGHSRDIADPWYTGEFETTYQDVQEGCRAFLKYLKENGILN